MLESLRQDLRHGLRVLAANPGFTVVAVLSIALGIGANAAMFSIADGMALRPLRVPHVDNVIAITGSVRQDAFGLARNRGVSYRDYLDLRDRSRSFTGLIAYQVAITSVADRPGQPARSELGLAVTGNFFDVLQLVPALGRTFRADEDRVPGRDAVVALAHDTWVQRFGSDSAIVGRHLLIGGIDFTVIGVAPESFPGMDLVLHPAFYVPLAMVPSLAGSAPNELDDRGTRLLWVRGRLRPDVSMSQAQQDVDAIGAALQRTYPGTNRDVSFVLKSERAQRLEDRGPAAPATFMLIALAVAVLLVACANVAGLLLSRAPVRAREISLRLAIGGSRTRIIRQLLTETSMIAVAGAALGLAVGYACIRLFARMQVISDIGVRPTFELDARVLWWSLALTVASALAAGLVPAWRTTHATDIAGTLKLGVAADARRRRVWGRNLLVAGQVGLSLAVLTIAVFLYRTFELEFSRPGFRTGHMLLVGFDPQLARYDDARALAFYRQLRDRLDRASGTTSVGFTSVVPLNQDYRERSTIAPEGYRFQPGTDSVTLSSARIDEGYLPTMGIALVGGRNISSADTATAPAVAVINQALASRYWPGQNPIGKRFRLRDRGDAWVEVVGVAADSKNNWIAEPPRPFLYLPQQQAPGSRGTMVIGTAGDGAALAATVRAAVQDIAPAVPISSMRTMEEFYQGNAINALTAFVRVVAAMGAMGVVLAIVGLYALVSYAARRRTREIAIRMAVGARPASVLRLVLGHGALVAGMGTVAGIAASAAIGGTLRAVVPNAGRIDLVTYVLVVPALIAITLAAAYLPARRAAHVDPLVALRVD